MDKLKQEKYLVEKKALEGKQAAGATETENLAKAESKY